MASSTDDFATYQWINPAHPSPPAHSEPHGADKTPDLKPGFEVSPVSADSGAPTKKLSSLSAQASSHLIKSSLHSTVGDAQPSADARPNLLSPQADSCIIAPYAKSTGEAVMPAERHTLKTFNCVPKLPFELRTMILTLACHEPRIIDLWIFELPCTEHGGMMTAWGDRPYRWRSSAERAPALLHASRETRTVVLKCYSLAFETTFSVRGHWASSAVTKTIKTPAHIWVNWGCDIICRMPDNSGVYGISLIKYTDTKYIRRLALKHYDAYASVYYARKFDLEELILTPVSTFGALSTVYDTQICDGKNVSFGLSALGSENKTETFDSLRRASMRTKGDAELTMNTWLHFGEPESLTDDLETQNWKALEDWEMPKVKLMLLDVHVGGRKYEVCT